MYYDKENLSIFVLLRSPFALFPLVIVRLGCGITPWLV